MFRNGGQKGFVRGGGGGGGVTGAEENDKKPRHYDLTKEGQRRSYSDQRICGSERTGQSNSRLLQHVEVRRGHPPKKGLLTRKDTFQARILERVGESLMRGIF